MHMSLCRVAAVIVVLQLLQCSTAHQTRPLLPANTTVREQAHILMVLQNHKTLNCVNKPQEKVQQTNIKYSWTLWYLLSSFKNKDSGNHWASHCTEPLLKNPPPPQSSELYDNIWPDIFKSKREDADPNPGSVRMNWEKEGNCAKTIYTPSDKQGKENCISEGPPDLAHCYYQQAQQLYEQGIHYLSIPAPKINPTTRKRYSVSDYLDYVLWNMFTKDGVSDFTMKLKWSTVQEYFSNNKSITFDVNPYLGCQYEYEQTGICYLTRVGLCFKCYVTDPGTNKLGYCTPRHSEDSFVPGILASCGPQTQENNVIPWNQPGSTKDFHDIPCYKCRTVRYIPPEEPIVC